MASAIWLVPLVLLILGVVLMLTLRQSQSPSPIPDGPVSIPTPSPVSSTTCGILGEKLTDIQTYIVNGKDSFAGKFPWMVSFNGCGGSVITDKWVLSAAHCQIKTGAQVAAGVFNRLVAEPQRQLRKVVRVINHPQWNQALSFANDICLCEVDPPFKFTTFVGPICLPSQPNLDIDNKDLLIMGWGSVTGAKGSASSVMREAVVRTMSGGAFNINKAIQFGAGNAGNVTTCFGDSGGPVVLDVNGVGLQVGIVSFGSNPCKAPSYYTRVSAYTSWIESIIGNVEKISGQIDSVIQSVFNATSN